MRRLLVAAVVALGALIAASGSAGAATTTIGSNLAGSPTSFVGCPPSCTLAHSWLPPDSQAPGGVFAPSDGVVVRWRIKVGSETLPAALRITRPGFVNTRTGAGTGPTVTPPINQTSTYNVRLPIQFGDALGLDCCADPNFNFARFVATTMGTVLPSWQPRLQDGEPPRGGGSSSPSELLINADIEADADQDGFGDESQDQCPGQAGPNNGCPAATSAAQGPAKAPPTCNESAATVVGTTGNDVRTGTSGKDVIVGLGGKDKLSGLTGNDLICGGSGKDTLKGGKGNDKLYGEAGKDTLKGGPGKDKLKGGAGKDKQIQ